MAGSAIDASTGGKGAQSDNTRFAFGRAADRSRIGTAFPLDNVAKNAVKPRYVYDYTKEAWEKRVPTEIVCALLQTTRKALLLDGGTFDSTKRGTKSAAKSWKVKVCSAKSSVARVSVGSVPTGSPAKYTFYDINVPSWVNTFVFAHSIFNTLKSQVNYSDGTNVPNVGEVVGYVSPNGRYFPFSAMNAISKLTSPPSKESAYDTLV
jgi:hypothetical protein